MKQNKNIREISVYRNKNAPEENISTHCEISCWQTDMILNDLVYSVMAQKIPYLTFGLKCFLYPPTTDNLLRTSPYKETSQEMDRALL